MLVADLLKQIPSDTKERVAQAYSLWNRQAREAIMADLRLSLAWKDREYARQLNCSTHIEVDEVGMPESVTRLRIPPEYELAARLALWLSSLRMLRDSAADVTLLLDRYATELQPILLDVPEAHRALRKSWQTAETLLRTSGGEKFDLVQFILAVDEDVLGAFWSNPNEGEPRGGGSLFGPGFNPEEIQASYEPTYRTEIRLYWGIIGLVARVLGVSVEGMTVVVLAHELGHAYTHLGFDRDGLRWSGCCFARSERRLKESMAQYYAARVAQRFIGKFTEAKAAYDALLPKQPPDYHGHESWLADSTPEAVAATIAHMRRRGVIGYSDFNEQLLRANKRLKLVE